MRIGRFPRTTALASPALSRSKAAAFACAWRMAYGSVDMDVPCTRLSGHGFALEVFAHDPGGAAAIGYARSSPPLLRPVPPVAQGECKVKVRGAKG